MLPPAVRLKICSLICFRIPLVRKRPGICIRSTLFMTSIRTAALWISCWKMEHGVLPSRLMTRLPTIQSWFPRANSGTICSSKIVWCIWAGTSTVGRCGRCRRSRKLSRMSYVFFSGIIHNSGRLRIICPLSGATPLVRKICILRNIKKRRWPPLPLCGKITKPLHFSTTPPAPARL